MLILLGWGIPVTIILPLENSIAVAPEALNFKNRGAGLIDPMCEYAPSCADFIDVVTATDTLVQSSQSVDVCTSAFCCSALRFFAFVAAASTMA